MKIQLKKFLNEIESLNIKKIFSKKKINIFLNYEIFKSEINQIYHRLKQKLLIQRD